MNKETYRDIIKFVKGNFWCIDSENIAHGFNTGYLFALLSFDVIDGKKYKRLMEINSKEYKKLSDIN